MERQTSEMRGRCSQYWSRWLLAMSLHSLAYFFAGCLSRSYIQVGPTKVSSFVFTVTWQRKIECTSNPQKICMEKACRPKAFLANLSNIPFSTPKYCLLLQLHLCAWLSRLYSRLQIKSSTDWLHNSDHSASLTTFILCVWNVKLGNFNCQEGREHRSTPSDFSQDLVIFRMT